MKNRQNKDLNIEVWFDCFLWNNSFYCIPRLKECNVLVCLESIFCNPTYWWMQAPFVINIHCLSNIYCVCKTLLNIVMINFLLFWFQIGHQISICKQIRLLPCAEPVTAGVSHGSNKKHNWGEKRHPSSLHKLLPASSDFEQTPRHWRAKVNMG